MAAAALCTLALGPKYSAMAGPLFAALARAGNRCVVTTDNAADFPGCEITPFVPDGTHPWHMKRFPLRHALETGAQTAYWIDADSTLGVPENEIPVYEALPEGFRSPIVRRALRDRSCFHNRAHRLQLYLDACERFGVADPNAPLIGNDTIFTVSKDDGDAWQRFFIRWDEYAFWLRDTGRLSGDNLGVCFAALHAGWWLRQDRPRFLAMLKVCVHMCLGDWRKSGSTEIP